MNTQNKNIRVIFVSAISIVLVLCVYSYSKITAVIESAGLVNHANQVSLELEKLISSLKGAETSQRGFLLTHEQEFLQTLDEDLKKYPRHIAAVRKLTSEHPEQQQSLATVERLAQRREMYLLKLLQQERSRAIVDEDFLPGLVIMDSLRSEVGKMIARENDLLEKRSEDLLRQTFFAPASLLSLSLIALSALVVSFLKLDKSLIEAQKLKEEGIAQAIEIEKSKEKQESDKRFRDMVEQAPVAMVVLRGSNFVVEVANEKQLEIWGKTKDQVMNLPLFDALPEARGQGIEQILKNAYSQGKPYYAKEIPVRLIRKGTEENLFVNFSYQPLLGCNGIIDGIVAVTSDVTEQVISRKKIEDSEQRFRLALSGSSLIVFSQDKDLKHTWIYNSHPDFKPEDIIGKTDHDLHIPKTAKILHSVKEKVLTTGIPYDGDVEIELAGQQKIYRMHIEALKDFSGISTGIIGTVLDITETIRTQQKIKESEELFSTFGNNIQNLAWIAKGDGNIFWYNQRWLDYTGRTLEEMKDWGWQKVHHPDHVDHVVEVSKKLWVTNEPFELTFPLRRFDGEYRWFLTRGVPITDENGNIYRWIGTNTDITDQKEYIKKIEESEERFRSLAQTLPQLVWVTDEKGNAEFASYRWKEYSGVDPEGENEWNSIVHPEDIEGINKAWMDSLKTGEIFQADVRLKSKEGNYRWFTVRGVPVLNKKYNIVKWVGAYTDIHEQKVREEKKDEFISVASHEMKTPLTTAKAYLQMLELSLDDNNEEVTLFVKKANQSINSLTQLISELLDVSKIQLGKLNYKMSTFDFNELIDDTVESIKLTSPKFTIIKTGQVYNQVSADKERIQQVLINLLNNAIKYSPSESQVFITVEQEEDTIKVAVEDKGIGISKQSLPKIFDKYYRVEDHADHIQGLGIGLYISFEIIQRHHGRLWAESELGRGSTFYFTIPIHNNLTL